MAPTIQVLNSDFGLTIQALFMNSVLFKGLLAQSRAARRAAQSERPTPRGAPPPGEEPPDGVTPHPLGDAAPIGLAPTDGAPP